MGANPTPYGPRDTACHAARRYGRGAWRRRSEASLGAFRPRATQPPTSSVPQPRTTAAIVQAEVAPDLATALARTAEGVRDARAAGASLVVFPETWIPGYPAWLDLCRDAALWDHAPAKAVFARLAAESVTVPGAAFDALAAIARDADLEPQGVLVAVDPHLQDGLDLPARGALVPELGPRPRPVPGLSRLQGARERLRVHVSDHEGRTRLRVRGDAGDEPGGIEARRQDGALLELALRSWGGEE